MADSGQDCRSEDRQDLHGERSKTLQDLALAAEAKRGEYPYTHGGEDHR